ncbi:MAG: hypothetical protein QOE53_693 [Pseudonocardiales bacterium]|nr:hypothetical protein [Pseudonocardiales bacterium]
MRWSKAAPACTVGVLLLMGATSGCASSVQPPVASDRSSAPVVVVTAGTPAGRPVPGTDPAIQRWFLDNGAAKVAFNDALLRAERGVASGTASECKPLSIATQILNKALPKLTTLSAAGQKLVAAIQPALTTFGAAATACLAKDFATARTSLDAGIVQQADGQAMVDEILDGDV